MLCAEESRHEGVELMSKIYRDIAKGIDAGDKVGPKDMPSLAGVPHKGVYLPKLGNYKMTRNFNSALCNVLLRYLKPDKGERILDLGCSRGFYVRKVEEYTESVIGVDISESSLREAVTLKVRYGDVTNLDFEAGSFDKVYSLHTIEHIPDLRQFFSEMDRVLRPGGIAIIVYPCEPFRGLQAMVASLRQYKNPFMAWKIHLHRLTPKRIKQLVEGTLLSHVESKFIFALGLQYLTVLSKEA